MSSRPLPILVLAGHVDPGTGLAAAALAAGALDILGKDDLDLLDPASPAGSAFRHRVMRLEPGAGDPSSAGPARHPRRSRSGAPRVRDRRVRVGWWPPGAGEPARRAAGRLPDPGPRRAAHRRRFHRRPGPLAGPGRPGPRAASQCPGPGLPPGSGSPLRARISRSGPPGGCHSTGALPPGITAHLVTSFSPASPRGWEGGRGGGADRDGPRRCGRRGGDAAAEAAWRSRRTSSRRQCSGCRRPRLTSESRRSCLPGGIAACLLGLRHELGVENQ